MHQVQRMVGERFGKLRQVARDIFGIAAKINQRFRPIVWSDGDLHLGVGYLQHEARCLERGGLREVDQRTLEHQQRDTECQVQTGEDDDENHQGA